MMKDEIYKFLQGVPLFSMLPENELAFVAAEIKETKYPKTTVLAVQRFRDAPNWTASTLLKTARWSCFMKPTVSGKLKGYWKKVKPSGGCLF